MKMKCANNFHSIDDVLHCITYMMILLWIFINIALKTTEKYPTWNHEKGYLSASLAFSQDCIQGQQVLSKSEKIL